ncbi:MAG: biotin/lipoyl-containing protein, partial [Psychrobacter sp.]
MDIKAPDLGVDSAEVSEIMIEVGDVIEKDENIILLESDKASVEVPSSAAGKVTKISVAVGDQVSEGMVLIELESAEDSSERDDESTAEEQAEQPEAKPEPTDSESKESKSSESESTTKPTANEGKSTTHALPDLGVEEAQVSEIMVSVGDTVSAEQSILLIESDKASVEVPAPEAG